MHHILHTVKKLRGNSDFQIDTRNSNPYRLVVKENLGETSYCFSTPIYEAKNGKLINLAFHQEQNAFRFQGSNCNATIVGSQCILENEEMHATLYFDRLLTPNSNIPSSSETVSVLPAFNGATFYSMGEKLALRLTHKAKHITTKFNDGCLCIMKDKFQPLLVLSSLYATNQIGEFAPIGIRYKKPKEGLYEIELFPKIMDAEFCFEVNLYAPKLFQDTTVESLHVKKNNAFGPIAFLGRTAQFGEQWLYLRPDFSKLPELHHERIDKILFHIPMLNSSTEPLELYIPKKRFCSFGSTWDKKVPHSELIASVVGDDHYITFDVTDIFTHHHTLIYNEGLILKKKKGQDAFIAISTGDCYSLPQILEIRHQ